MFDSNNRVTDDFSDVIQPHEDGTIATSRIEVKPHAVDQPVHRIHISADVLAENFDERFAHTRRDKLNFRRIPRVDGTN